MVHVWSIGQSVSRNQFGPTSTCRIFNKWESTLVIQQGGQYSYHLWVAQGDELAPRMRDALLAGELGISALSPRVTTGKEQWQGWHHDFALNQQAGYVEDDLALRAAAAAMSHTYEVVDLDPRETALQVRTASIPNTVYNTCFQHNISAERKTNPAMYSRTHLFESVDVVPILWMAFVLGITNLPMSIQTTTLALHIAVHGLQNRLQEPDVWHA